MENSLCKTSTLLLTIFPCYVAAFLFRNIIAHFTWNISEKQCFELYQTCLHIRILKSVCIKLYLQLFDGTCLGTCLHNTVVTSSQT